MGGRAAAFLTFLSLDRPLYISIFQDGTVSQRHVTLWRDPWFPSGRRGQNGMGVACLGSRSGSNLRASQDPATLPDPARQPRSLVWGRAGRRGRWAWGQSCLLSGRGRILKSMGKGLLLLWLFSFPFSS